MSINESQMDIKDLLIKDVHQLDFVKNKIHYDTIQPERNYQITLTDL